MLATSLVAVTALALPAAWRSPLLPFALGAIILWDPTGRLLFATPVPGPGQDRYLHAAVDGQVDEWSSTMGQERFSMMRRWMHLADMPASTRPRCPISTIPATCRPQAYRNHWLGLDELALGSQLGHLVRSSTTPGLQPHLASPLWRIHRRAQWPPAGVPRSRYLSSRIALGPSQSAQRAIFDSPELTAGASPNWQTYSVNCPSFTRTGTSRS